jgi:hypothetical protein
VTAAAAARRGSSTVAANAGADLAAAERRRAEVAAVLAQDQQDLPTVHQAVAAGQQEAEARTAAAERGRAVLAELGQRVERADAAQRATSRRAAKASAFARADIPRDYLQRYQSAAGMCRGLSWPVLAAVGRMESAHGRSDDAGVHSGANQAGAMGPMQFLAGTWAAYGADGDGDGQRDVYNPDDAVLGAADYLCAAGAGRLDHLREALWAYNHADWYVEAVLAVAARYGADLSGLPPPPPAPVEVSTGS